MKGFLVAVGIVVGAAVALVRLDRRLDRVQEQVSALGGHASSELRDAEALRWPGRAHGRELPYTREYGPTSGVLAYTRPNEARTEWARSGLSEFTAEVLLENVRADSGVAWNAGLVFGHDPQGEYRLYLDQDGRWTLMVLWTAGKELSWEELAGGAHPELTKPGVVMRLTVKDRHGFFWANGQPVAAFGLFRKDPAGSVGVGTAFTTDQPVGTGVRYSRFMIWTLL